MNRRLRGGGGPPGRWPAVLYNPRMRSRRPGHRSHKKIVPPAPPKPARPAPAAPTPPKTVPAPARPTAGRAPAIPAKPVAPQAGPAPANRPAAPPPPQDDPLVGRVLGRCRLQERIGQGRTATVYRAHHEALDATVAVKILLPWAAQKEEIVKSFETEARAIARIDNENVLKIYDVGREGDLHFIVMELLDGDPVLDLIQREGRLDVMDALRVTRQAANGLAAAHANEILHRDVKPQNLVLLEDGTVKLVDFGLAGEAGGDLRRVGTPHFMAPETCESGAAVLKSDVYSLGVTLYHMLVGKPPYLGQDVPSIMRSHVRGEPLRPERHRPGIPREIGDLLRQMTRRVPDERPSAVEVLDALDKFGGESLREKTTLRRRRSRMRAHIAAGRNRSAVGPLAALAVLVAVALLVFLSTKKTAPETSGTDGGLASRGTGPGEGVPLVLPTPVVPPVSPSTSANPTPMVTPPTAPTEHPTPPAAPAEDPAVKREADASVALAKAESWAREHWKGPDDDAAVVGRYRAVASQFSGTKAGEEANHRVVQISSGQMPAHPDQHFATEEEVAAARAAWDDARPKFEEALKQQLFLKAAQLVPPPLQERRGGTLSPELAFWRTIADHLVKFQIDLSAKLNAIPANERTVEIEGKYVPISKATEQGVKVEDGALSKDYAWADLGSESVADLATRAFHDAGAESWFRLMEYAFAEKLGSAFWDADLDLGIAGGYPDGEMLRAEMKSRLEARLGS